MITAQEQIDLFYNKYSYKLVLLLEELKNDLEMESSPILNNTKSNLSYEFIQLFLDNIDLKKMYIKDTYKTSRN